MKYSYKKELAQAIINHNSGKHMQVCVWEEGGKLWHKLSADGYLDQTEKIGPFDGLIETLEDAIEEYFDEDDDPKPEDLRKLHRLHNLIEQNLFMRGRNLSYDRLTIAFTRMIDEIPKMSDEFIWDAVGEHSSASLGDLIVGAAWHYMEWNNGQNSQEYKAYCAASSIFSPGMADGPEEDGCDMDVYNALNAMAQAAKE